MIPASFIVSNEGMNPSRLPDVFFCTCISPSSKYPKHRNYIIARSIMQGDDAREKTSFISHSVSVIEFSVKSKRLTHD